MRTKLFHTIVLCGAAFGAAVACSDGDDSDNSREEQSHDECEPGAQAGFGGEAAESPGAAAKGGTGATANGCGGWPPTK